MKRIGQLRLLYVLPIIAVLFSLAVRVNYFSSIIVFWGIPSILLTFWARRRALKVALCAIAATMFSLVLDAIFYINHQWDTVSMFKSRFLGIVAWEDILYFFLFIYFPIIFWEHFYEPQRVEKLWTERMIRLSGFFLTVWVLFIAILMWTPHLLVIPYFYLIVTIIVIGLPLALELLAHPKFNLKFFHVGLYFAFVAILYELAALYLELWHYPSTQFIGWINFFELKFPIEELFSWIILGAPAILAWYEYFDDDNR